MKGTYFAFSIVAGEVYGVKKRLTVGMIPVKNATIAIAPTAFHLN